LKILIKISPLFIKLTVSFVLLLNVVFSTFSQNFTEHELKAGYIINFEKFVHFPNLETSENFVVGIFGTTQIENVLREVAENKVFNDKKWLVVHFSKIEEIKNCHILYISNVNYSQLLKILQQIKGKPILSVGNNIVNFCQLGGMINFTAAGSRKRFEINNKAANKVRLKISSKLLMIAKIIE